MEENVCSSAASTIARTGSERGERRRGEDERWKGERALQQWSCTRANMAVVWRETRCFRTWAAFQQAQTCCSWVLHPLAPRTSQSLFDIQISSFSSCQSVCLSVSITDRQTDRRACLFLPAWNLCTQTCRTREKWLRHHNKTLPSA